MTIRSLVPRAFGKKAVPVRYDEESPLSLMRREMDEIFGNFFSGFDMEPWSRAGFAPKVDVSETDKEIKVSAELPGMDEKDIDLSLNRDSITIKGEKKTEKEEKGKDFYRMERSYGSFTRTIPIPVEIDTDNVNAEFRKGVLTVTLPKSAKALQETRKIRVKVE